MAKPALGRGLGALLGGPSPASNNAPAPQDTREQIQRVPIHRVQPCSVQPRKTFCEDSLRELADSIREQGILQPLIVRPRDTHFELIAGERRWRAAQLAGLTELPVVVREADDRACLELALIENLQRENLNPLEEALGFSQLIDQFDLTQEEAAVKVGKSRAAVANAMRLLKLAPEIQAHVRDGRLSVGHAKVILALGNHEEQNLAAERILKKSLNVRQTEELIAALQRPAATSRPGAKSTAPALNRDAHVAAIESQLQERFGTRVRLRYRQGKGAVEIHFFNDDDLERILQIAGVHLDS